MSKKSKTAAALDENVITRAYLRSCEITLNIHIIDDIKQLICKYSVNIAIPFDTINSVGLKNTGIFITHTLKNENSYFIHSPSACICGMFLDPLYVNPETGYNYYTKGNNKHCWRVCYRDMGKSDAGPWFLMGISIYGHKLKAECHVDENICAISGQRNHYYINGKTNTDISTIGKLLEYKNSQSNIGQCDMLIDFDSGTIEYKSVKDDKRIKFNGDCMTYDSVAIKQFDINNKWIPLFACYYGNDEMQIAKIPISLFGIRGDFVKFDIIKQWETNNKYDHEST